jgi:hypothetical protein
MVRTKRNGLPLAIQYQRREWGPEPSKTDTNGRASTELVKSKRSKKKARHLAVPRYHSHRIVRRYATNVCGRVSSSQSGQI